MNNNFSNNIKTLRNKLNLTQKDFAEKIQVTAPTLNAYEKGTKKPNFDTLIKISQEFNISLDELCGLNGDNPNNISNVETYSDVFKTLISLFENDNLIIYFELINNGFNNKFNIKIQNKIICEFLIEYKTMSDLKDKGSISDNIFNEWYNSKLDKYNDRFIEHRDF